MPYKMYKKINSRQEIKLHFFTVVSTNNISFPPHHFYVNITMSLLLY